MTKPLPKPNFHAKVFVFSVSYVDIEGTQYGSLQVAPQEPPEMNEGKAGFEIQRNTLYPQIAQQLVQSGQLPCLVEIGYNMKMSGKNAILHGVTAEPVVGTETYWQDFLDNVFNHQARGGKNTNGKSNHAGGTTNPSTS